jgi:FG-GAP-like repeat/Bacterial Ig-like domain (group 3)/FG-GAP repeat
MNRTGSVQAKLSRAIISAGVLVVVIALAATGQKVASADEAAILFAEAHGKASSIIASKTPSRGIHADDREKGSNAGRTDATNSVTSLFLPAVTYDSGGQLAWSLAVADLNGDGNQDIVVVSCCGGPSGTGAIGVLLGNGDGAFEPAVVYDPGGDSTSIAIVDLNGDGKLDLVVGNGENNPNSLSVLLGNGDGTFQPAAIYALPGESSSSPNSFHVLIGDLNGDGKPDLVAVSQTTPGYGDGAISVLLGKGNGTFLPVVTYDTGGFGASSGILRDLNGDGKLDLVVANCGPAGTTNCGSGATIGVLLGKGNGTFRPVTTYARTGWGDFSFPVIAADMNGDGIQDLVVGDDCVHQQDQGCTEDGVVNVFIGTRRGTFSPAIGYDSGAGPADSVVVSDLNADGKLDVVIANNGNVSVALGNGNGTLQPAQSYFFSGGSWTVSVADFNGDGKPDIVVTGITESVSGVLLGNGDGTFFGPLVFDLGGSQISQTFIADVNGDGRPDLLSTNWTGGGSPDEGAVGVLLNNPDFVFNNTTTTLASNADPSGPNKTVSYTAVIHPQLGGTASGWVWFLDNGVLAGGGQLANNQATFTTKYKKIGVHPITAIYLGDSNFASSRSSLVTEYIRGSTMTRVSSSGSPSHVGESVTFTARVSSYYGLIPDGDLMTFSEGKTVLGTVPLASGVASITTSFSKAKRYTIKAVYTGDAIFKTSRRSFLQVVEP